MGIVKITVMSQLMAEEYSRHCSKPTYIISITVVGDRQANIVESNSNIKGILRLSFDDVSRGDTNCITESDAKTIISFVNGHWNENAELVVHCGMGISRSAGVAAAILKAKTGDDTQIMDSPAYRPNMTVYSEVLEAFVASMTQEELNKIINRNN